MLNVTAIIATFELPGSSSDLYEIFFLILTILFLVKLNASEYAISLTEIWKTWIGHSNTAKHSDTY